MKAQVPPLSNDRLLRALKRQAVDRTPLWIMRQAGRYLPEYRATRKRAGNFLTLCRTPELACEVSLQPLDRYPLDAAIIFSDILVIPDAMGLGLQFYEGEGPAFTRPVDSEAAIRALQAPPQDALAYVYEAIALLTKTLAGKVPVIGFSGSPWTLASYMVEGRSSPTFAKTKALMHEQPHTLEHLLDTLSLAVAEHLQQQLKAGADCVMIFDTWGGMLSHAEYLKFSLEPVKKIVASMRAQGFEQPITLFTKGGGEWLEDMAQSGVDALGIDWTTDIQDARRRVGERVALQGNLDPAILLTTEDQVRNAARQVIDGFGDYPGHIFNLGHGIHQKTDPAIVTALIDEIHNG